MGVKQKFKSMRSLLTALIWISFTLSLAGCATTTIETSGPRLQQPLCVEGTLSPPVAIYWRPQWRPDQKEPPVREELAQKGIERFIGRHACLNVKEFKFLSGEPEQYSNQALVQQAAHVGAEQIVLIAVRELGPKLLIGLPNIVKGGTEVVIEVRVLDTATSAPMADMRTHWESGGTFVVRGLWTLEEDMSAALEASLM